MKAFRTAGATPRARSPSRTAHTQEYVSIGLLGAATTSYDSQDPVISTGNFDNITREDVEKALEQFRGKIKQTPPM